jgi:DegV family protein with EDD domain
MPQTCIVTDSTACFTRLSFPGQDHVNVIPCFIKAGNQLFKDNKELSLPNFPEASIKDGTSVTCAPTVEAFRQSFDLLGQRYRDIIVILASASLSHGVENALRATQVPKIPATIHIIDSQTIAVGLGLLVQTAAEALHRGLPAGEITRLVRSLTRHIYAVFCLPDLTHLACAGQLDPSQAYVGEMLGILPLFIMENGRLVHTQKIRSPRHMVDIMFEFIAEFEHLRHLALLQGVPYFDQESRNIRERIHQNIRATPFSEHTLPFSLATILGPRAIGLIAVESVIKEI